MKTDAGIIKYGSLNDYRKKTPLKDVKPASLKEANPPSSVKESTPETPKDIKDKVEISNQAKEASKAPEASNSKPRIGEAIGAVAAKAAKLATNVPLKVTADLSTSKLEKLPIKKKPEVKVNEPAVIFISGMKLGFSSGESGLEKMSKFFEKSEHFNWTDEGKAFEKILKHRSNQPVVLVGHSLGGDAAINIAKKLNTLEHGYRRVDLLVTLDSFGLDNDIVPQNVLKNMNFIGEKDIFLNDGPNIAKNTEITEVINELRSEYHTELDDSPDVQFKIFNEMTSILG